MSTETRLRQTKLHKKVKLAIGRSKSPKEDYETLDSKKKGFRGSKNDRFSNDETLDSKKKGFRGNRNDRFGKDDAVDVPFRDTTLYKRENGERRNVKSNKKGKSLYGQKVDGERGYEPINHNRKRKRVYADRGENEDGMFHKNGEKPNRIVFPRGRNELKYDVSKEKRCMRGKSHNFEELERGKVFKGERKSRETDESLDSNDHKKSRLKLKAVDGMDRGGNRGKSYDFEVLERGKVFKGERKSREIDESLDNNDRKKLRLKLKAVDKMERGGNRGRSHDFEELERGKVSKGERETRETESLNNNDRKKLRLKLKAVDKMDHGRNSSMKNDAKNNYDFRKQSEQKNNGLAADSLRKSGKKKAHENKSVGDNLAEKDERPTKSKRVIRIDPRDVTNKRLDDGIVRIGHTEEKKEDVEKNESVEMSKNAQFRAIKPSPSIISYVEDNFLGRRRLIEIRRAGYNTELSAPLDNIPSSTSLERERIEEPIFRNKLEFFAAANISSSFPPPDLPEIAFAGRSNVGKSSLLNALTRQWGVVRTSDKPGLTQTINFFKLGTKLSLVDLPGYGFAYAKEEVKEAWEELVREYVSTRVGLKRVCLLIDTKWGMKPRDHELIDLMERSQTKYQIVLTKTDLVFPIDVARRAMQIEESLKANKSAVQPLMMASSKTGAGIRSLRTVLAKIARFAKV